MEKSGKKGNSNALGYLLAGAVGIAAGFFVTKALADDKDEEKKKVNNDYVPQNVPSHYQPINNSNPPTSNPVHTELESCEDIVCPITLEVMQRPVMSKVCGHSFEQSSIVQWLDSRDYCPKCHVPLTKNDLIENYSLKNTIEFMRTQAEMFKKN